MFPIFASFFALVVLHAASEVVPGCPEAWPVTENGCACHKYSYSAIGIYCYGASIVDLNRVVELVVAANKSVAFLSLSEFREERLTAQFFEDINPRVLEIKCRRPSMALDVANDTFNNMKDLVRLQLICQIENVPDSMRELSNLEELEVESIGHLEAEDFSGLENLTLLVIHTLHDGRLPALQGLPKLEGLHIYAADEMRIGPSTFVKMPKLKELTIHSTNLDIHNNAFEGLQEVTELTVRLNELDDELLLKPLHNLQKLFMSSGNLRQVSEDAFLHAPNLTWIDLGFNELSTLSPAVFDPLPNLDFLRLSANPWICDDKLRGLIDWLNNGSHKLFSDPFEVLHLDIGSMMPDVRCHHIWKVNPF